MANKTDGQPIMTIVRTISTVALCSGCAWAEHWAVVASDALRRDAAFQQAVADLNAAGASLNIEFTPTADDAALLGNTIVVGGKASNRTTASLAAARVAEIKEVINPQGFRIQTIPRNGERLLVVAGGSALGDVYGLYWVWDRLRVFKQVPDINIVREPRLPVRLAGGDSPNAIRNALRYGATWCTSYNILDLIPWDTEPERTANAHNRVEMAERITLAHDLHMKFLAGCDEITYHPSLWTEFDVSPSPADPALWKALQEKYRRLFRAMPELDGVLIRTGELTLVHGAYRAYDVMHEPDAPSYPLADRYRIFVTKMHEVVVGEFNKIYFHRTWGTSPDEQHSDPNVFRAIFTDAVPTRDLYLSPYMTRADRWLYQPYNPTFNRTPHSMVVLFSSIDYHAHAGVNVIPIYPGQYFHDFLQTVLSSGTSNLVGVHFAPPAADGWQVQQLTAYAAFRLAWDPSENPRTIAEDFAAIHFGRKAAPQVAEILVQSYEAYKNGCYIKPVAESITGNTLPHLRLTTFPVRGIPAIDKGKEHIAWLRSTMYTPCKDRTDEAIVYLDRGLETAQRMETIGSNVLSKIDNAERAKEFANALALTRALVEANNRYVKTCFAFFTYRDAPTDSNRKRLEEAISALDAARRRFIEAPGFVYKLYGIDQLLANARDALIDLDKANQKLANAPESDRVKTLVADYQTRTSDAWAQFGDKVQRLARWKGTVDGKELIHIQGKDIEIEHIDGDPGHATHQEVFAALPQHEVTVLVNDAKSRPWGPFVLEQPCAANGYKATLLLFDAPPSSGTFDFEIGYIEASPKDLGLILPWDRSSSSFIHS